MFVSLVVSVTSALNRVCLENLAYPEMLVVNEACVVAPVTELILQDYLWLLLINLELPP